MPISPNVNAFLTPSQETQTETADQIFIRRFGERAFSSLRATYPEVAKYVVTFKTLEHDLDAVSALGVFIVRAGNGVLYVPVVMQSGDIVSCEMIYSKQEDIFSPLIPPVIAEISSACNLADPRLLSRPPKVEDTRQLFRNLIYPPASSMAILASEGSGVGSLPRAARLKLASYFQGHPELLARVSEFYPVEKLAEILGRADELPAAPEPFPGFLRLDGMRPDDAEALPGEVKEALLKEGYAVLDSNPDMWALPLDSFIQGAEAEMGFEVYIGEDLSGPRSLARDAVVVPHGTIRGISPLFSALAWEMTPFRGLKPVPVLGAGSRIFMKNAVFHVSSGSPILLSGITPLNGTDLPRYMGFVTCDELPAALAAKDEKDELRINLLVPTRNTGVLGLGMQENIFPYTQVKNTVLESRDGEVWMGRRDDQRAFLGFSDALKSGWITTGFQELVVPRQGTLIHLGQAVQEHPYLLVRSFNDLRRYAETRGNKLVVHKDDVTVTIKDAKTEKMASFASEVDAAEWLHARHGLSQDQVRAVLGGRQSLVFSKTAMRPDEELARMQGTLQGQHKKALWRGANSEYYSLYGEIQN